MEKVNQFKILIVDDKSENLISLAAILKREGYQCDSALSGVLALGMLLKNQYGLIILDVQMPEMNGIELAELIKGNSKTKNIPLIFLSASPVDKEYFSRVLEVGALDYLTKPVDENLFLFKVNKFLELHHSAGQLAVSNKLLKKKAIFAQISYEDLYYSLPQEVFIINKEGIVISINRFENLYCGLKANELLNRHFSKSPFLTEILGDAEGNAVLRHFVKESKLSKNIEFDIEREDKTIFYGQANITSAIVEGKFHIQLSVFDISEKKRSEEILKLQFRELENSEKINKAIINGSTLLEVSKLLLKALDDISGVKSSRIYMYDESQNKLNLICQHIEKNLLKNLEETIGVEVYNLEPTISSGTLFGEIIDKKLAIITSDENDIIKYLSAHANKKILAKLVGWDQTLLGIKTFGVLPIISNDVLLGLITFASANIIKKSEKQTVIRFSNQAAAVLAKMKDEQALMNSENRFKLAMQGANDGLWDWNVLTDEVYLSPVWKSMLGYEENELAANVQVWTNLLHPEDKKKATRILGEYLDGKIGMYESEFRMKHKDGRDVFVLARGQAVKDADGKIVRMIGTHVDVTERKRQENFIRQINESVSVKTGTSYFSEFTKFCCETLGVKYAMVGNYMKDENAVETISFRTKDSELPTYKYDLTNTPCSLVIKGDLCVYPKNVQSKFPFDLDLKNFGIESYLGVPLLDENKMPLGIIVLLDDKPMEDVLLKTQLISFLGARTSNELSRRNINQKLKESEAFNQGILSSLGSHIAVINSEGIIISVNEAWNNFAKQNGVVRLERTGIHSNYFEVCEKAIEQGDVYAREALIGIKSVLNNQVNRFEMEYPCHSREKERWYILSVTGFEGDNHKVVIRHVDISERKKTEETIKQSEERFRTLFERNLAGVYRANMDNVIIECNEAFAQIIGINKVSEVIGKHVRELYDNLSHPSFEETLQDNEGKLTMEESIILKKNGEKAFLLENASLIRDSAGNAKFMEGTIIDITKRKEVEEKINESEKRYRGLFEKMNEGLLFSGPDLLIKAVNPSFCKMVGYTETELLNKNGYQFLVDESIREKLIKKIDDRKLGISDKYELEFITKSKNKIITEISANPTYDSNGNFAGTMSIITNISQRKQYENEIIVTKEKLESLVDNINDGLFQDDLSGKVVYYNKKFLDIFGYCETDMNILTIKDFAAKEYHEQIYDRHTRRISGEKVDEIIFYEGIHKNGQRIWIESKVTLVIENNEIVGTQSILRDITDRKKQEDNLKRTVEELSNSYNESMQFNYIVSHNLRAPIANLLGLTNILRLPDITTEEKTKTLEFISQATLKMDELIGDLSVILAARSSLNSKMEKVSFISVIKSISDSLEGQILESGTVISTEIDDEADQIFTIRSYCESILFNLISNSIKYRSYKRPLKIIISIKTKGEYCIISVKDNGMGIDLQSNGKYMFGLYKRFNYEIEGKGLGLHMTKTQVTTLNGRIAVESEVDKGALFTVTLPNNKSL